MNKLLAMIIILFSTNFSKAADLNDKDIKNFLHKMPICKDKESCKAYAELIKEEIEFCTNKEAKEVILKDEITRLVDNVLDESAIQQLKLKKIPDLSLENLTSLKLLWEDAKATITDIEELQKVSHEELPSINFPDTESMKIFVETTIHEIDQDIQKLNSRPTVKN